MTDDSVPSPSISRTIREWWQDHVAHAGCVATFGRLVRLGAEFLRDSTPARRRQRYGDVEYDWDHRVDTTGATVGWRDRLLGLFHSPYQPTEPALFHEMLASLQIDFREFTFIDVGSGKGRVLLMASDYPFRRVLGIELLPELNRVAQENIRKYKSDAQRCFKVESVCANASSFIFPAEPTVIYLFNPLPESGLVKMLRNLERSEGRHSIPMYLIYHNPLLHESLAQFGFHTLVTTDRYVVLHI
jgi:hypothetical protein